MGIAGVGIGIVGTLDLGGLDQHVCVRSPDSSAPGGQPEASPASGAGARAPLLARRRLEIGIRRAAARLARFRAELRSIANAAARAAEVIRQSRPDARTTGHGQRRECRWPHAL